MKLVLVTLWCAGCASAGVPNTGDDAPPGSDSHGKMDAAVQKDAPSGACTKAFSGVLASYSFSSQPGNQATTPVSSVAPGIVAGAISRSASLSAVSGANSMNSSNWSTSASLDTTKYYALTITPPAGCVMDLAQLSIDASASSTGPAMGAVGTDADAFATTANVATAAASTPALSVSGASHAVELRVFGYGAMGAGGTMRLQTTLAITGVLR